MVGRLVSQSASQPVSQSASQSVSKSVSQSVRQMASRLFTVEAEADVMGIEADEERWTWFAAILSALKLHDGMYWLDSTYASRVACRESLVEFRREYNFEVVDEIGLVYYQLGDS